jgi:hypothetical protein
LPEKLSTEVSIFIQEEKYESILFMREKTLGFIAWFC